MSENNTFLYLTSDLMLVELPHMSEVFDTFDAIIRYMKAYTERDVVAMIILFCEKVPEFEELIEKYEPEEVGDIMNQWAKHSQPNEEDDNK